MRKEQYVENFVEDLKHAVMCRRTFQNFQSDGTKIMKSYNDYIKHQKELQALFFMQEGISKMKINIDLNKTTILITGAAGFIGANLIHRLIKELNGSFLVGLDNMNDYYDPELKKYRLQRITDEVEK